MDGGREGRRDRGRDGGREGRRDSGRDGGRETETENRVREREG